MEEYDVIRIVRQVLMNELPPIVMGIVQANSDGARTTVTRFYSEPPRSNLRSIAPYGFASKAPPGTQAFIVPAGGDQTNLNVVGHFDPNRPPLGDGEVALYDAYGHALYLSRNKIQLGTEASSENLVLGQVLKTMLSALLDAVANHTHAGIGAPPTNAAAFTSLKSSPVDDGAMLSNVAFTERG